MACAGCGGRVGGVVMEGLTFESWVGMLCLCGVLCLAGRGSG